MPRARQTLFAGTIFLSAFLLFLVQPLIARIILPWFGGTAAVWTTCLMFFQIALLAGYVYAHWLTARLKARSQVVLHISLLAVTLLALPILPSPAWKPAGSGQPLLRIIALLAATVGAPYFVLSTTGPLLQAWYARSYLVSMPYRFYALSNFGSLLALLAYPAIIEPSLGAAAQSYTWSAAYVGFVVLCGLVALVFARSPVQQQPAPETEQDKPGGMSYVIWVGLAACPSALLLAITTHITQNIAPIPLLWVLPLGIYLLTLILCFESDRWYKRIYWYKAFVFICAVMTYILFPGMENAKVWILLPIFLAGLFVCGMACHGELASQRPAARWLTNFYLMLALGGALGGVFVGLIAPLVFNSYLELPLSLFATVVLVSLVVSPWLRTRPWGDRIHLIGGAAIAVGLVWLLTVTHILWLKDQRLVVRNFYGQLRTKDVPGTEEELAHRDLLHGTIRHGSQYTDPKLSHAPTLYYVPTSGVGRAIQNRQKTGPIRAGMIGLGAGTLAAYGRSVDVFRFYDINPLVESIARSQFTYLPNCPAKVTVVLGDARRSLELEEPQHYDVLAVDAFSSDAIPVHLLTREAFQEYFRHLKPQGILAMHISNRHLRLEWVVRLEAQALAKYAIAVVDKPDDDIEPGGANSDWILISSDPKILSGAEWEGLGEASQKPAHLRLWTDDYSNLLYILK